MPKQQRAAFGRGTPVVKGTIADASYFLFFCGTGAMPLAQARWPQQGVSRCRFSQMNSRALLFVCAGRSDRAVEGDQKVGCERVADAASDPASGGSFNTPGAAREGFVVLECVGSNWKKVSFKVGEEQ